MPPTPQPSRPGGWNMHIWFGCDLFAWLRLLYRGRFRVGWRKLRLLPTGTLINSGHTFLRYVQEGLYGSRIRATKIARPPVFILGHWRSGTTLLHELLVQDPRHNSPNTYQCFDPCHFLLTERLIRKYFSWLLPARRMMDNMPVGWGRPQEEEFALALLGAPSPYLDIAFPNEPHSDYAALDLDGLPAHERALWKRTFLHFLQTVSLRDPRRLVLKSPPHTCRIPALLELFPDARFIHIVRNPVSVYASTVNLWRTLQSMQALQAPDFAGMEERVFTTFNHFHARLAETRGLVPANRFHELKYEDLTKDAVGEMRHIYEHLDLGDFESARPHIDRYVAETSRYECNKYEIADDERAEINRRWGEVIQRFGYDRDSKGR